MKTFAKKPAPAAAATTSPGERSAPPAPHPRVAESPHERWTAQLRAMLDQGPRVAELAGMAGMLHQRPAGAVVQRAIKINPNIWYTDPQDIAAALPLDIDPVLLRKVQSMGRDGRTHPFDNWEQALEHAAKLDDPGEQSSALDVGGVGVNLDIGEQKNDLEEAQTPGPLSLAEMDTMADLLGALRVDVERYMAPTDRDGYAKVKKDVARFNNTLQGLAQTELWKEPFNVTVMVGDLKGFGDVTAGAKLAKALKAFFGTIEQWRDVNVRLYLDKVTNLQAPKHKKELESTISTARAVLGDAGVGLEDVDELEPLDENVPSVSFAYPAINLVGADFSVSQYGHDPFAPYEGVYGSGPGFGALGVMPVSKEQQEATKERAGRDPEGVLRTISELKTEFGLESMHFGYFSIYEKRPKEFAQRVVKSSPANRIGVALSRPQDNPDGIAASLAGMNCTVHIFYVAKDGTRTDGKTMPAQGSSSSSVGAAKEVCLIILMEGVAHPDMLSLYYASDAPVGATGDQSFLEAYTMRGLRNEAGYEKPENVADIEYDVTEQQKGLFSQMTELATGEYLPKKQPPLGLKPINVSPEGHEIMTTKDLLFPIVMLINATLKNRK